MRRGVINAVLRVCVLLFGLLAAGTQPVAARTLGENDIARTCYAGGAIDESLAAIISDGARWKCNEFEEDISPERLLISYELAADAGQPESFKLRRSRLETVHIVGIDSTGKTAVSDYPMATLDPAGIEGMVSVPVPKTGGKLVRIVVAFDMPTTPALLTSSSLDTRPGGVDYGTFRDYMIVSAICGMLLLPFLFNFAFWRVLRERFLIWHTVLTVAMLLAVSSSSNLMRVTFDVSNRLVSDAATISFGATVAAGSMFAASFIEEGKLHPWLRRALPFVALYSISLSLIHAAFPYVLRPIQVDLYLMGFLPVLAILITVFFNALYRRSRAMLFQVIGWAPLVVVGMIRQFTYLTAFVPINDAMHLFYFGCAFEVLATAMGVADRMMILKVERDSARVEARSMEQLAGCDPLTGLLNRRALDEGFSEHHADGYETFALIDLDHFKSINDQFGHDMGDRVLKTVGEVLNGEKSCIGYRLGGEEFLLMMRGANTAKRAEALRQALSLRIAREVDGLDRVVTASMGLLVMPRSAVPNAQFSNVYSRVDMLLYEAKSQGRNRTVSERLQAFGRRREDRRLGRRPTQAA
ncbi:MAG: diguanylate cyclase [Altererythrobacter sp.]